MRSSESERSEENLLVEKSDVYSMDKNFVIDGTTFSYEKISEITTSEAYIDETESSDAVPFTDNSNDDDSNTESSLTTTDIIETTTLEGEIN